MLVPQDDTARCDELFAMLEARLRDEDRRLRAPTAVLRLKAAIAAAVNADLCLAALSDLRSVLSGAIAERGELAQRCQMLEAALGDGEHGGAALSLKASAAELPTSRAGLGAPGSFVKRLSHVFGTHAAPPPLAVLRIDLGQIDDVAATHESATRAQILHVASARMAGALRAADVVTRVDEDEFACVLPDLSSREQLTHLACKMLEFVSAPMQIDEVQFSLRPSIGIAVCPHDGDTADQLLIAAGAAMRRARAEGSGYAFSNVRAEVWASQFSNLREQ